MTPERVVTRLLAKTHGEGDCVVSDYSRGNHRYSQIGWCENGKRFMQLGHRVAWESENGRIPAGLTIDHLCRNRGCINVSHMRLLSNVDNARDNGNARKTHCPQGHPYDEANTYNSPTSGRICRACRVKWR